MTLLDRLTTDMKTAMKARDANRLQVIRMMLSDVKNIDLLPGKPTAEAVVESYAKKLKKSLEEYDKLGKSNEVQQLRTEIAIVDEYLPKRASADETGALIDTFLAANAFTEKDAGRATGMFMKQHGAAVDPGIVAKIMKEKLAGK